MRSGTKARRFLSRHWSRFTRRAWLAAALWLAGVVVVAACQKPPSDLAGDGSFVRLPACSGRQFETCPGQQISAAWYGEETTLYPHGVLGDAIEYSRLEVYTSAEHATACGTKSVRLGKQHVFEDLAPRLVDLDGDGTAEIITIRSHVDKGAQIAIYGGGGDDAQLKLIAATPYIGRRNRWLAPVGAADLDRDGYVEIAYVDRPHLAKTLRVWRFRDGKLEPVADQPGLTNHRIGQDFITSGIRDCGQGPEMITVDAGWDRVMVSRLQGGQIRTTALGPFEGRASVDQALTCS
ncbi:VCBS repeat-containing protein [Aliisedimentitalea scapharcae]|uniref:VCBS repeat-containing protein n=1 Tax=Aliisedimentitalea scapharcae TaxID=1524259 RepID=A0ABZ2XUP9_9RHOB